MARQEDVHKLAYGDEVELFELDLTSLGGQVYRFTPSVPAGSEPLSFGGNSYLPVDISIDGFEVSSRGSLPTPTVRIANTTRAVTSIINELNDDLIGCKVTRIKTLAKYLDGYPEEDPSAFYPPDIFVIEQKTGEGKLFVEFQLCASIDVAGQMLPRRQILRNYCARIYRRFDPQTADFDYSKTQCPYRGNLFFNRSNQQVASPADDHCSKTLEGCKLRFAPASLPGWFFPGAGRYGSDQS
jgi:lambda family phage minor tail protein L